MTDRQQSLDVRRTRRATMGGDTEYLVGRPGTAARPTGGLTGGQDGDELAELERRRRELDRLEHGG